MHIMLSSAVGIHDGNSVLIINKGVPLGLRQRAPVISYYSITLVYTEHAMNPPSVIPGKSSMSL